MLIKKPEDIKASEITEEKTYFSRRNFIRAGALAASTVATGFAYRQLFVPEEKTVVSQDKILDLKPSSVPLNLNGDEPTDFIDITNYNNFYEFSTSKNGVARAAKKFVARPWTLTIEGLANKPKTFDLDEIFRIAPLEERTYRLRCVETWSMVIPWVGLPLGKLLEQVEPLSSAKYVTFETLVDPERMPNQKTGPMSFFSVLDWPYKEGLRMDEALHPLTILAVGLYGKVLLPANGAPIRLVVPWKYGFKSIKSIVKIKLVDRQPVTTWNLEAPSEYGFYANVNPKVSHPRWSQAEERRIGEYSYRDTSIFNGYGEQVASLYNGMDLNKYY
ncbi:MAG: protein-methionine-sulfoxide reductase catalytic subunit MsrP [Acidobacteria bacterium]|nr:protein-methionine-sulfoxide reductase catalytic subunit MsrP [Acidobacteriota bacterium]